MAGSRHEKGGDRWPPGECWQQWPASRCVQIRVIIGKVLVLALGVSLNLSRSSYRKHPHVTQRVKGDSTYLHVCEVIHRVGL